MSGDKTGRIVEVLSRHRDIIPGGLKMEDAARDWEIYGFSAEDVEEWLNARCFLPKAAYDLAQNGFTPALASIGTDEGVGGYVDTIGYKVSRGEMSIYEALRGKDEAGV